VIRRQHAVARKSAVNPAAMNSILTTALRTQTSRFVDGQLYGSCPETGFESSKRTSGS